MPRRAIFWTPVATASTLPAVKAHCALPGCNAPANAPSPPPTTSTHAPAWPDPVQPQHRDLPRAPMTAETAPATSGHRTSGPCNGPFPPPSLGLHILAGAPPASTRNDLRFMQPAPAKTFNVRALAAEALAEVTLHGTSLRDVLTRSAPRLADPRDRAMLSALLHEGARWWLRYDAALGLLMERPVRRRQPAIHALMVIGLVQIEVLKFPSYAAVGATVDAVRTLKRPRLAPMVNAVLRRWLRERETLIAELDADPITHHALPEWLVRAISEDWPGQAESVFAANNIEPPLTIRVNRRRS